MNSLLFRDMKMTFSVSFILLSFHLNTTWKYKQLNKDMVFAGKKPVRSKIIVNDTTIE